MRSMKRVHNVANHCTHSARGVLIAGMCAIILCATSALAVTAKPCYLSATNCGNNPAQGDSCSYVYPNGRIVTGTVVISHGDKAACDYEISPGASTHMGMTWGKAEHNSETGTDLVMCKTGTGCDPRKGDMSCEEELPILCISIDGSPDPGIKPGQWRGWAAGHITTTTPIQGRVLEGVNHANEICESSFGKGWHIAQFHDGVNKKGWMFEAFGNVRTDTRFWVYIRDQKANCWD